MAKMEKKMTDELKKGDLVALDGETLHVTRVGEQGTYGHSTKLCSESGCCAAYELYLGTTAEDIIKIQAEADAAVFVSDFPGEKLEKSSDWDSAAFAGNNDPNTCEAIRVLGHDAAWAVYSAHLHAQFEEPIYSHRFGPAES